MSRSSILRALAATTAALSLAGVVSCADEASTAPTTTVAPQSVVTEQVVPQADAQAEEVQAGATPSCWTFQLKPYPPYPNPARIGNVIRQQINLINLATNRSLYGAIIYSEVYQGDRLLFRRAQFVQSSPKIGLAVWEVPYVLAGTYRIRLRAFSGLTGCDFSPWTTYTLRVI
ncbi:MAG: hypothetical protein IT358_08485 [Gemmatimonadaceae bacterium]|jgi:hypothetical protein|nr:hypothetical protein [Gemmatimonadaceae bacterium]